MRRIAGARRAGWEARVEGLGLTYHTGGRPQAEAGGGLCWEEGAHWAFTATEVDAIEDAAAELHRLALQALDHLTGAGRRHLEGSFGLPPWFADHVARSWARRDPSLMGRMDLAFDPATGAVKLLEYNADTPTLAIETALVQWDWLEARGEAAADQFNSLHEKLLARFQALAPRMAGAPLHLMAFRSAPEEWQHATYFADLAQQAGIAAIQLDIAEVGWDGARFLDLEGRPIRFLHKLYPWEWVVTDAFGPHLAADSCGVLEPPWKALLSDKAILAILWRLFPGHPNLLEARLDEPDAAGDWVRKPCLGREGANIALRRDGRTLLETPGAYGGAAARWLWQRRAALPSDGGLHAVIGAWIVDEAPAGMILREDASPVIRDSSPVVPHLFR
ncbi:MAG: glutathionylspermidine synthase family protein [Acetobacteraceae bacterium]|nr:glutathionylspermidine synthase family protein [Acetobacteraceae bacterium]